ncbi:MAG: TfoX/Sxy family protein [Anaerolineales bacterium]|nr:TfoX/Sxy family protein [Anaerolineales bacterium]
MAYNEKLAEQMRAAFGEIPFVEKKMFGGIGFLIQGNLACGIYKENMIVRVGPEKRDKLLKKPHTSLFDITGRPMRGWLMVEPDGCKTAKQVSTWVKEGIEFALTLPAK